MDEYERGMDPEVKKYFRKIVNSFAAGLLWLMTVATAGIFFRLGMTYDGIAWYTILFYILSLITLLFLLRHLYRIWSR